MKQKGSWKLSSSTITAVQKKKKEKEISVNAKAKCGKLRGEKIFGKNGSYQWFMINYQLSDNNQKMAGTKNNG